MGENQKTRRIFRRVFLDEYCRKNSIATIGTYRENTLNKWRWYELPLVFRKNMGSIMLKAARSPADLPLRKGLNFPVSINILRIRRDGKPYSQKNRPGEVTDKAIRA